MGVLLQKHGLVEGIINAESHGNKIKHVILKVNTICYFNVSSYFSLFRLTDQHLSTGTVEWYKQ